MAWAVRSYCSRARRIWCWGSAQHEGGFHYLLASSLGTGPIQLGNRQLRLSPDAIFVLSVGGFAPQIFERYFGQLDSVGSATARIRIPNLSSLKGVLLFNAFEPGG